MTGYYLGHRFDVFRSGTGYLARIGGEDSVRARTEERARIEALAWILRWCPPKPPVRPPLPQK